MKKQGGKEITDADIRAAIRALDYAQKKNPPYKDSEDNLIIMYCPEHDEVHLLFKKCFTKKFYEYYRPLTRPSNKE